MYTGVLVSENCLFWGVMMVDMEVLVLALSLSSGTVLFVVMICFIFLCRSRGSASGDRTKLRSQSLGRMSMAEDGWEETSDIRFDNLQSVIPNDKRDIETIEAPPPQIRLPSFSKLKLHYPGYKHFGGKFTHKRIKSRLGYSQTDLLHDTSALRLSFALNKIGGEYSIGTTPIHLSKHGKDSVQDRDGLQYLYNPIAFGPYFADKYGYPNVSVLHQKDPIATKKRFWGKQGVMEIITYTKKGNFPKGHIALWDCDHIHQAKDWISKHTLITVEFWETPDSSCPQMNRGIANKETKSDSDKTKTLTEHRTDKLSALNSKTNRPDKPSYVRVARVVIDNPPTRPGIRYDTFRKAAYDKAFRKLRTVYSYEKRYLKKPKSNDVI
ncbi:hypothetical protein FSP39_003172 [Pinctada imbricata]|uniref:Uncharacterized protein n=1 Tax=Pinctada imbricata TaxID=66713 RepID=A0AA89C0F6_PINIB|nr:hypothetical protein FSP39_003172 [Pinctada imbricata]